MERELTVDTMLYGLRCPNYRIRSECWYHFCAHYRETPLYNVKNIDFSARDALGIPLYSKSEMYGAFLLLLLRDPLSPQSENFLMLLFCETDSDLSISYLIEIVSRVENRDLVECCLPILKNRLNAYGNISGIIKLLERTNESNRHQLLPIIVEGFSHKTLDFESLAQIHPILQQNFLKKAALREDGFQILQSIVRHQLHPFSKSRTLLWQSLSCGMKYNPGFYCQYRDLLRNLVVRTHQNAESQSFKALLKEPSSPFNNSSFNVNHLIDILFEIKDEPLHSSKFSDVFWNAETYGLVCDWLESNILDNDQAAQHALPLLQHLACQVPARQSIKLFRLVEKIIYCRLWEDLYGRKTAKPANCRWDDFFSTRQDCPDFISSYGVLLAALLQQCRQGIDEKSFLEMCYKLHENSNPDIREIARTALVAYLETPAQFAVTFKNLNAGIHPFPYERFICEHLDLLNLSANRKTVIFFLRRMIYNVNESALREHIFKHAQNLFEHRETEFDQTEMQYYQDICALYDNNADSAEIQFYSFLKNYLF